MLIPAISISQTDTTKQVTADSIPKWNFGGVSTLNFTHLGLSNWAAGGEKSYSLAGLFNGFIKHKQGKRHWDNSLSLGYGVIKQDDHDMRKADDKVDFMSTLGYRAVNEWYYSAMINLRTQMATGYKYEKDTNMRTLISDFMAPAYIVSSVGMEYKTKKDNFHLLLSPATGKTTILTNDSLSQAGAFAVEPGRKSRQELGGYLKVSLKKTLFENVNLAAKMDIFSNYMDSPENIDINIEALLTMKVNKFLSASFTAHVIYDDDINITDKYGKVGPRTQLKEILAIGLSYKFI